MLENMMELDSDMVKTFESIEEEKSSYNTTQKKFFPKKEERLEPYIPIAVFVDRDYPQEVKEKIYHLIDRFLAKGYVIRINGLDKDFVERVLALSHKNVEVYLPWKGFNNIDSKFTYNSKAIQHITATHFPGWEKIANSVKAILMSQVRMLFGEKNNSVAVCIILYTQDGANKLSEITKETGKLSFIIKLASSFGFSVINIAKDNSIAILEKNFRLG